MSVNHITSFSNKDKNRPNQLFQMFRKRSGLTQAQLAAELGLSNLRTVQYWEGNQNLPNADKLKQLIELYVSRQIFTVGEEADEIQQLWQSVKEAAEDSHYRSHRRSLLYPGLDEGWLAELLEKREESALKVTPSVLIAERAPLQNLPASATALVGRQPDIAQLLQLLKGATRLLTVCGPGGTGKTRLALQVAREALPTFPDGVYWVDLATFTTSERVITALLHTLNLGSVPGQAALETLKNYLRGRRLLLLLDNFEQVLVAAPLINRLLVAAPALKVLVTSRAVLHLKGEQEYNLLPLALPARLELPSLPELIEYEAVQLFVERVRQVKPDFELTHANARAVADICIQLDGLPLALELAAAQMPAFTPETLLAHLQNHFELRADGSADSLIRRQTLRTTLDWSYTLLSEPEQQVFRNLGVCAGGCTFEAAHAIVPPDLQPGLLKLLNTLVEKSLLKPSPSRTSEPRFNLLEAIREFALEKLANIGQTELVCKRHVAYFLDRVEQAAPPLQGSRQTDWFKYFEQEYDNLNTVLARLLEWGELEKCARLSMGLGRFWWACGYLSEGRHWFAAILANSSWQGLPKLLQAKVLGTTGVLAEAQHDYILSQRLKHASLALYRKLNDKEGIAFQLNSIGSTWASQGKFEGLDRLYTESLKLLRELGDKTQMMTVLGNLGEVYKQQGKYAEAWEVYAEALGYAREAQNQQLNARLLSYQGVIAYCKKEYALAKALQKESLLLYRQIGDKGGVAECLERLAVLKRVNAELKTAALLFGAAEALRETLGVPLPLEDPEYVREIAALSQQLSEPLLQQWQREGRGVALETVIVLALA